MARGALCSEDGQFSVPDGADAYYREAFGIDISGLPGRRPLVRACTDWTERRPHVAGALGKALLDALLADGTLKRRPDGRALNVTRELVAAVAPRGRVNCEQTVSRASSRGAPCLLAVRRDLTPAARPAFGRVRIRLRRACPPLAGLS